ncbi:hypothetical protein BKA80DRAFT_6727 [Phyllosticta citrichinensis]
MKLLTCPSKKGRRLCLLGERDSGLQSVHSVFIPEQIQRRTILLFQNVDQNTQSLQTEGDSAASAGRPFYCRIPLCGDAGFSCAVVSWLKRRSPELLGDMADCARPLRRMRMYWNKEEVLLTNARETSNVCDVDMKVKAHVSKVDVSHDTLQQA